MPYKDSARGKEYAHALYIKNRAQRISRAAIWRMNNLDRDRENKKLWIRRYSKQPKIKEYHATWMREWRRKNPEKALLVEKRRQPRSRTELDKKNTKQREQYTPMIEKQKRISLKLEIMNAYGGPVCKCCGETIYEFLSIDHVNGGGHQHRKAIGVSSGDGLYKWLKKNSFPSGFQVLCFNCNLGKAKNKNVCPHQKTLP